MNEDKGGYRKPADEEAKKKADEEAKKKADEQTICSYVFSELLLEDKTVRDRIHGDIIWNHLETQVIDTKIFQRLRRIRQLGTVHLVFPGAEYSRFPHSLGTLHMASTLLDNVAANRSSQYQKFGKTELQEMTFRLTVRLAALLHDVHEFPLSHTLEKEGNIFPKQWKNNIVNIKVLGTGSEIYEAINIHIFSEILAKPDKILNYIKETPNLGEEKEKVLKGLTDMQDDDRKELAKRLTETIITLAFRLISGRKDKVSDLAQELFQNKEIIEGVIDERFLVAGSQVVVDTVCADLLDYLARDFYFCGIRKTYDERFLKYATVTDCTPKPGEKPYPVFAYRLCDKRREIKSSVVSSLFDVLELRYTITELAHTNRTKNAFSVMVIEAFNYYYQSLDKIKRKELVEKMLDLGDDELLLYLRDRNDTSRHILDYYCTHNPYNEYVLWNFRNLNGNCQIRDALTLHLRRAKERYYLEKLLVEWLNSSKKITKKLEDGDCLLYAMQHPGKLYKELYTNVVCLDEDENPKVESLFSLSRTDVSHGVAYPMRSLIERSAFHRENLIKKYQNLWRTSLFISPKVDFPDLNSVVAELIEKFFLAIGQNISTIIKKTKIPDDIYVKLTPLLADTRQFKTFEEIFKSYLK